MESHYTATGLVLNCVRDRILLVFHRKLQVWLPAGGHVEEGELPHEAVVREVFEETGIRACVLDASKNLLLDEMMPEVQVPAPFFVLHELIPAYKEKSEHMHYDFIYKMQAFSDEYVMNLDECESVAWFSKEQLLTCKTFQATRKMGIELLCKAEGKI